MMQCQGVYTALITPFRKNKIAFDEFEKILIEQCEAGVDGVIVAGTTGEAATLSEKEFATLVEFTTQTIANKAKIFVGIGSCDTTHAVGKTQIAAKFNIDGLLAVTPYYNKPTQNGLIDYYSQIASSAKLPIIMYSIPSRCGVEIEVDTAKILSKKYDNIVGLKEATDSCKRVFELKAVTRKNFSVLAGNDSMLLPFMSAGACGTITAAANILPKQMVNITALCNSNKFQEALCKYNKIADVIDKMSIETNPLPVKYLMSKLGKISSAECRSPLGELSKHSKIILDKLSENLSKIQ